MFLAEDYGTNQIFPQKCVSGGRLWITTGFFRKFRENGQLTCDFLGDVEGKSLSPRRPEDHGNELWLAEALIFCGGGGVRREVISRVLRKNAVESRSLPWLVSQSGPLNGGLGLMPEWLSWSCWADWLLAVPVQDHPVHGLATAAPWIAGSGPAVPVESSVSRAFDARCAQEGQEGKD